MPNSSVPLFLCLIDTHVGKRAKQRLILIRVRSGGDVRRPPADWFRGTEHDICTFLAQGSIGMK